jgi:hypothetical protein
MDVMFDIGRRLFILKKACGRVFKIGFTRNNEIVVNGLSREQIWYEPSLPGIRFKENSWGEALLVRRDAHPSFSACIDAKDDIHVLCQDYMKNIVHVQLKSNQEKLSRIISGEGSGTIPNLYPELLPADGGIMLFHMTGVLPDCSIATYRLDLSNGLVRLEGTEAAEYARVPYIAVADGARNIYLFYKKRAGSIYSIGYKKYLSDTGLWSSFNKALHCGENSELLSAAVNFRDDVYILRQESGQQGYELICSVKRAGEDNWTDFTISGYARYPYHNSSITALENCIIIYWYMDNSIFFRLSVDSGRTWGKHEIYAFNDSSPLQCIAYRSNMHEEYSGSCINPLPGKIGSGYRLAFINEYYPRPGNLVTEELKDSFSRMLGQNAQSMELLKQTVDNLRESLAGLDARLSSIEKIFAGKPEKKSRPAGPTAKQSDAGNENGPVPASPLMPGSGFTDVTPDYLKSLRKKD